MYIDTCIYTYLVLLTAVLYAVPLYALECPMSQSLLKIGTFLAFIN